MEYLRYRGTHLDVPFEDMMRTFAELYPMAAARMAAAAHEGHDFEKEVVAG